VGRRAQAVLFPAVVSEGSSNATTDTLSRCPAFTTRDGGITSATNQTMLDKKQWLEVGAMELDLDNGIESIQIMVMEVEQLLTEAKERIKEKAMLDIKYRDICKQVSAGGNVDKSFSIKDELLCWKNRMYVSEGLWQRITQSEHDLKVAQYFRREWTCELITRNFHWVKMQRDMQKYCSKCDNCQRMKAPTRAKHRLQHPLELGCKPWTHISTDFITDLLYSEGATMILVVVDQLTKMAHFIRIKKKDSPTVARACLENIWNYHESPEVIVSNRNSTFTGSFFTDLYNYLGITPSMSTAYQP
jgi:hypothetical protein